MRGAVLGLAISAIAGNAMAADYLRGSTYEEVPKPGYGWSGFYVGVNAGYGGDRFTYPFDLAGTTGDLRLTSSGFVAGGQVGYNFQFGPSGLVGVEADLAASDIKGEVEADVGGQQVLKAGTKLKYLGTVRARLGWASDQALFYATGGFAYGKTRSAVEAPGFLETSISHNRTGWTVGAGMEYAFSPWASLKTEYLYVDLGKKNLVDDAVFTLDERARFHVIRAGVNVRFP